MSDSRTAAWDRVKAMPQATLAQLFVEDDGRQREQGIVREALELAPEHPEALAGRRLVKELLRRGPRPTVKPAAAAEP